MSKPRAERNLAATARLFSALADETRLALLQRLVDRGPASISALVDTSRTMTRQGVTKHLHVLARAGIIDGQRQGREHVWALNPGRLGESRRCLELIARNWDDALSRLVRHVEGDAKKS